MKLSITLNRFWSSEWFKIKPHTHYTYYVARNAHAGWRESQIQTQQNATRMKVNGKVFLPKQNPIKFALWLSDKMARPLNPMEKMFVI